MFLCLSLNMSASPHRPATVNPFIRTSFPRHLDGYKSILMVTMRPFLFVRIESATYKLLFLSAESSVAERKLS